MRCMLVLVVVA